MGTKILVLAFALFAILFASCGDDDDDDMDSVDEPDDDADDDLNDDVDDDDVNDDVDDDTGDDDTGDDDAFVPDPMDVEYNSTFCTLNDPESLGDNLIGGGPFSDTLKVYVFDDLTCEPIQNATIIADQLYYTNADGMVEITPARSGQRVSAFKDQYIPWAYEANAAVMYFRLRPVHYDIDYAYDWQGTFLSEGEPIEFLNPQIPTLLHLANLLNNPLYAGIAFPGFSRKSLMHVDMENFFPPEPYQIDIATLWGAYYFLLTDNIYIPDLLFNVLGINMHIPDHSYYQFPIDTNAPETAMGGALLKIDLGQVLNLQTLQDLIEGLADGEDILDSVIGIVPGLLQRGITIPGAGLNAGWDGLGNPDIELERIPDEQSFTATITNGADDADYLGILWAEIPNRAMTVMDLIMADNGVMDLQYEWIPDADYILTGMKTDMVSSWFAQTNFSFAFKYGEDSETWIDGVTFDDSDFPPYFNMNRTYYDPNTHTVQWEIDQDAVDAVLVIHHPGECIGWCSTAFAMLPPDAASYTIPDEYGGVGSEHDITILIGLDLPDDVDVNNWNPVDFWANDVEGMTIWMMPHLFYLIGEFIYE